MGEPGIDALWDALKSPTGPEAIQALESAYWDEVDCPFNLGLVACIPKGDPLRDAGGVAYFHPGDFRPISMVDTAKRLMASAARIRWKRPLAD